MPRGLRADALCKIERKQLKTLFRRDEKRSVLRTRCERYLRAPATRVLTGGFMAKVTKTVPTSEDRAPSASPSTSPAKSTSASSPTPEAISRRAYEIFQARGGEHGHHDEDWAQAERELKLGRQ
jgi:hypothetical protein